MWQILLTAIIAFGIWLNYEPKTNALEVITPADKAELNQILTKI